MMASETASRSIWQPMVLRTDEIHLIRAAQVGDLFAFEELVRRHRTPVYRVALRMLGNAAEAEDAAQDASSRRGKRFPGSAPKAPSPLGSTGS